MPKRPLSVTLVALAYISMAAMNFLSLIAVRQDPSVLAAVMPLPSAEELHQAINLAQIFCVLIALVGFGVLRGLNWARLAVVAIAIVFALMGVMGGNFMAMIFTALQILMSWLLYRPDANAFFNYKRMLRLGLLDRANATVPDRDEPPSAGTGTGGGSIQA